MVLAMTDHPTLRNAARDATTVDLCVAGGATLHDGSRLEHDYREVTDPEADGPGHPRTYLVCVWCKAVACGNAGQPDPCIEPWHHEPKPHRTAAGVTWPIGGDRPDRP